MITKKQLKEHISKLEEAAELKERMLTLEEEISSIKSSSHFTVRGTGSKDAIVDLIIRIESSKDRYYKKLLEIEQETEEIEKAIESLSSIKRRILRKRYLEGMTFESICHQMHYSWRHIHRLHGEALKELK